MNTEYFKEIVTAYAEGKVIEYREKDTYGWKEVVQPDFNFNKYDFRIKVEPAYSRIGNSELSMLRADCKYLSDNYTHEELATTKIGYNIFQITDLIEAISTLKRIMDENMPLKEQYHEELQAYRAKYGYPISFS